MSPINLLATIILICLGLFVAFLLFTALFIFLARVLVAVVETWQQMVAWADNKRKEWGWEN